MKIILTQDVNKLGFKDDVVAVKNGYGRNFLIPQGMAKLATSSNLKMLAEDVRQRAFKVEKIMKDAESIAERMKDVTVTLKTKAGATGKIFGSITTLQVANALKEAGYDIDRRKIVFPEEIKNIGEYKAVLNLHRELSIDIDLSVVSE